jgi:hypothetical protein
MPDSREIILCIPGPWEDRRSFLQSLISTHAGRYIFAGVILHDTQDNDSVEVDLHEYDPNMAAAFRPSGVDVGTLVSISAHKMVAYLHFPLDLPDQRERLLKYSDVIRKAGGIAVKLESCGLAHHWERWFEWMSSPFEVVQYRAAVIIGVGDEGCYSCGMHHFGFPDAETAEPGSEGQLLLDTFNRYRLGESPTIRSGETFTPSADSPRYRLHLSPDERFPEDHLFHNPHGVWRLERIR